MPANDVVYEPLPELNGDELLRLRAVIGLADASRDSCRTRVRPSAIDEPDSDPHESLLDEMARTLSAVVERLTRLEDQESLRDDALDLRIADVGRAIADVAERRLAMIELHDVDHRNRLDDIDRKLDALLERLS